MWLNLRNIYSQSLGAAKVSGCLPNCLLQKLAEVWRSPFLIQLFMISCFFPIFCLFPLSFFTLFHSLILSSSSFLPELTCLFCSALFLTFISGWLYGLLWLGDIDTVRLLSPVIDCDIWQMWLCDHRADGSLDLFRPLQHNYNEATVTSELTIDFFLFSVSLIPP